MIHDLTIKGKFKAGIRFVTTTMTVLIVTTFMPAFIFNWLEIYLFWMQSSSYSLLKVKNNSLPTRTLAAHCYFQNIFLFHIFDLWILRKSFIHKIRFVGLILKKIEGVKVYKPTPGGQPNKILFLFESSQEFTGGSDPFRTCWPPGKGLLMSLIFLK